MDLLPSKLLYQQVSEGINPILVFFKISLAIILTVSVFALNYSAPPKIQPAQ
jgi:hypothetical protein